jgi:hypothetical protein
MRREMKQIFIMRFFILMLLVPTVVGTGYVVATITVDETLSTITITPDSFILYPDETVQLSATALYANGTTEDITSICGGVSPRTVYAYG